MNYKLRFPIARWGDTLISEDSIRGNMNVEQVEGKLFVWRPKGLSPGISVRPCDKSKLCITTLLVFLMINSQNGVMLNKNNDGNNK